MERSILHTPKLEISNLICFGKIQCTCIEILREHGVEKQYLQLPVHMLILKKNSYTNTKIPTPINLFILFLVIHVQQSYIIIKLPDYAIQKE